MASLDVEKAAGQRLKDDILGLQSELTSVSAQLEVAMKQLDMSRSENAQAKLQADQMREQYSQACEWRRCSIFTVSYSALI